MTAYRSSRSFGAAQIRTFLEAVDRHLVRGVRIEVIGGSAAALAHGATSTTTDLDTFTYTSADLDRAVAQAAVATGLEIPVTHAAVADVPINYADRLERHLAHLVHLEVWVLERHDLALSKAVRCHEHDLQQLREIQQHVGLSADLLVQRFVAEMQHVIGDPARIRADFLLMIEDVFGELPRVQAERALRATKR